MTPVFALFVLQARSAPAFIEECSKAVAAIKEGHYGYEMSAGGFSQKTLVVVKNRRSRISATYDKQPYVDLFVSPTSSLYVRHQDQEYFTTEYPESKEEEKKPLAPLEYGSFDFKMGTEGLVLRTNPELIMDKIDVTNGVETLYSRSVKSDGKSFALILSRDAKTKLPTQLNIKVQDEKDIFIELSCKVRPVKDEELTIPTSAYAGYKKVDPPKSPSGTL